MSTIHEIFISALLADATYVDGLSDDLRSNDLLDVLSTRMTPTIAKLIADNFEVLSHTESNDVYASGFDATAWRGLPNTPYAGKIYVSMQGRVPAGVTA